MNKDFFNGSCDHVLSILSFKINAIDTPTTEANDKTHVLKSKGIINVR